MPKKMKKSTKKTHSSKKYANPWIAHVMKYKNAHGCTLEEAMKKGKKTYKKSK